MNEDDLPKKKVRFYTETDLKVIKCLLRRNIPMSAYEIASDKEKGIGIPERNGEVKESCRFLEGQGLLKYDLEENKFFLNKSNKIIDFLFDSIKMSSKGTNEMIERALDMIMRTIFMTKEGNVTSNLLALDLAKFSDDLHTDFPPTEKNLGKINSWAKKCNALRNPRY